MASLPCPNMASVSQESLSSAASLGSPQLLAVLPIHLNVPYSMASAEQPAALSLSSDSQNFPEEYDILTSLAEQFAHTQRILSEQHQSMFDFLARRLGTPGPAIKSFVPEHRCSVSSDPAASHNPKPHDTMSSPLALDVHIDRSIDVSTAPVLNEEPRLRPDADACSSSQSSQEQTELPELINEIRDQGSSAVPSLRIINGCESSGLDADRGTKPSFEVRPAYAGNRVSQHVSSNSLNLSTADTHDRVTKLNTRPSYEESHFRQKKFETTSCCKHMMLAPGGGTRLSWDIATMALVLYDMIVIPLSYLFEEGYTTSFLEGMIWTTRIFWTADLVASCTSGYVDREGSLEMRPVQVIKKYLRTWFPLDIVVVGSDWFEVVVRHLQSNNDSEGGDLGILRVGKMGKIFRILRMLRLLRLAKVGEIVSLLMERLPSETLVIFFDIVKLVIVMVSASHFIACIWFAVGCIEYDKADPRRGNWVDTFNYDQEELEFKYLVSLRWALSQYAGGMDEVTPVSLQEHLFSAFIFIGSFWAGTVILSILTSHMTQLYLLGSQQQQQVNLMRRYLRQHGVSKGLTMRVQRNAQHTMMMRAKEMPESQVGLDELVSEPLRMELHFEMYSPTLTRHHWFCSFAGECPHVARQVCHGAMRATFVAKDDTLFNAGEQSHSMLFCKSGELVYTWGTNARAHIDSSKWLSEPALWTNWLHRGILVSMLDSQVYYLGAKAFEDVVKSFKWMKLHPSGYAQEFVRLLNDLPCEDLSDLPFVSQRRNSLTMDAYSLLAGPSKILPLG